MTNNSSPLHNAARSLRAALLASSLATLTTTATTMAHADTAAVHNATITQGKYTILNNEWGLVYNKWGTGSEQCLADPNNLAGQWSIHFDWDNNPAVPYDQYHIKAYPSIIDGWQYGYPNPRHDFPIKLSDDRNVTLTWDFKVHPADPKNYKADVSWDIWLDPSPTPSGAAHQEIMIWPYYTGAPADEGLSGYVADVRIGGALWHVYRNGQSAPYTIDFVAATKTTSISTNLSGFLNYCTAVQKWIDPSFNLISVEAGTEVWYGKGDLTTTLYAVNVE